MRERGFILACARALAAPWRPYRSRCLYVFQETGAADSRNFARRSDDTRRFPRVWGRDEESKRGDGSGSARRCTRSARSRLVPADQSKANNRSLGAQRSTQTG